MKVCVLPPSPKSCLWVTKNTKVWLRSLLQLSEINSAKEFFDFVGKILVANCQDLDEKRETVLMSNFYVKRLDSHN